MGGFSPIGVHEIAQHYQAVRRAFGKAMVTKVARDHPQVQPVAGLGEALTIVDRMTVCHVIPMMRHLDITQVNVRTATIRMKIGITQASIMQV